MERNGKRGYLRSQARSSSSSCSFNRTADKKKRSHDQNSHQQASSSSSSSRLRHLPKVYTQHSECLSVCVSEGVSAPVLSDVSP